MGSIASYFQSNPILSSDTPVEEEVDADCVDIKDDYSISIAALYGKQDNYDAAESVSNLAEALCLMVNQHHYMMDNKRISKRACYLVAGLNCENGIVDIQRLYEVSSGSSCFRNDFVLCHCWCQKDSVCYQRKLIDSEGIVKFVAHDDVVLLSNGIEYILEKDSKTVDENGKILYYGYRMPKLTFKKVPK